MQQLLSVLKTEDGKGLETCFRGVWQRVLALLSDPVSTVRQCAAAGLGQLGALAFKVKTGKHNNFFFIAFLHFSHCFLLTEVLTMCETRGGRQLTVMVLNINCSTVDYFMYLSWWTAESKQAMASMFEAVFVLNWHVGKQTIAVHCITTKTSGIVLSQVRLWLHFRSAIEGRSRGSTTCLHLLAFLLN